MRFVHDDREPLARQLANLLGNYRELLKGRDDDGLARLQCLLKLPRSGVDVLHDAQRLLELAHRRLKLAVQHAPVGDHYDGVEDAAVLRIVKRGKLVSEPCNCKGLSAARRVLNQVALPRAM